MTFREEDKSQPNAEGRTPPEQKEVRHADRTFRRDLNDERRVVVSLSASGRALRARTKKMLGEFYCYLSVPVEELEDLRDRLHRFTNLALGWSTNVLGL